MNNETPNALMRAEILGALLQRGGPGKRPGPHDDNTKGRGTQHSDERPQRKMAVPSR